MRVFVQMVLKVHNVDGSTKMVAIHETMNAKDVCILLAERNHQQMGPNWTLVERLADLHLGNGRYIHKPHLCGLVNGHHILGDVVGKGCPPEVWRTCMVGMGSFDTIVMRGLSRPLQLYALL